MNFQTDLDKTALLAQGIFVDPMTDVEQIKRLVRRLRPVVTARRLRRLGSPFDGGYLVPDDLDGIKACFSPGVDTIATFEADLLKIGIQSHLADYSVDSAPSGFTAKSFTQKFVGAFNDDVFMTMDTWVSDANESSGDLLLQMDIEGGEYQSILAMSERTLRRFRIMVVEIHDVESWGQRHFFQIVEAMFAKLLANFHVVHNHPNNCCGLANLNGFLAPRVFELTFLRKDRAEALGYADRFPHAFDGPNLSHLTDLVLPAQWYAA